MHSSPAHPRTLPAPAQSPRFRVAVLCCCLLASALHASGAGSEFVLVNAVTADVAGQKVELAAGETVTVVGRLNGMAMIRVTLPNGSVGMAQTPEANVQPKPSAPTETPPSKPPASAPTPQAAQPGPSTPPTAAKKNRTKAETDALIEEAGNTKPDWWDSTPLNIPPNLDLTWKVPGGSPNDPGKYMWGIVYPNPGKWKEGVKLLQHSVSVCKGDPAAQEKAASGIAGIYAEMLGDYARGAFWAKKVPHRIIVLIHCYMKLDCPSAAEDLLRSMGSDQTRNGQAIKLWAELGDLKTALEWAEALAPNDPTVAYLAAGDACRYHGKIPEALAYYQKVLGVTKQVQRDDPVNKKRATASIEAIKLFDSLDLAKIDDGTYKSDSIGYAGPVEVSVTVKDHRIETVKIGKHQEKQFYSSLVDIPPQIVAKQSVKGIDTTTGATVTSEAIIYASAKALAGAQK